MERQLQRKIRALRFPSSKPRERGEKGSRDFQRVYRRGGTNRLRETGSCEEGRTMGSHGAESSVQLEGRVEESRIGPLGEKVIGGRRNSARNRKRKKKKRIQAVISPNKNS